MRIGIDSFVEMLADGRPAGEQGRDRTAQLIEEIEAGNEQYYRFVNLVNLPINSSPFAEVTFIAVSKGCHLLSQSDA